MSAPALRFKDEAGQDFPDWQEKSFKDVSKINQGLQIPISERFSEDGENRHFYITNEFLRKDAKNQYFIENPPNSVLCSESDVLMTRTGNTGKVVTNVKGAFHNNFFKIGYDKNILNKDFLCEFLCLEHTQSLILKLAGTSTIPDLNHSDFYKIIIKFPSLPEQTKIAKFLTSVDKKITQLTQKHDLLTLYKKGVMQQIFSQELRFKDDDGMDFPDWKTVGFGDIFSFKTTNSYSRECLNYVSGTVKNIHYGDIHTKFKSRFNIAYERVPYVNENITLAKINPDCFCVEGDLVIADASEDYKDIGKCIEIDNLGNQPVIAGLHTFLARPISGVLSSGFMSHAMQSEAIRMQIMTIAQGTKVLSISTGRLSKVNIPLPALNEQTKIANFLTAIDDKVTATQTQLQAVNQYKQGLLQQMFV